MPHQRLALRLLACAALALTLMPDSTLTARQAPARIVAIGDIHGAGEAFAAILREAGVADASGTWLGGRTTLVQTGDYLDRGGAVRQVMDLLMTLEERARGAGGRAEILLGNHEAMNLLRELRDVSPQAYASFADAKSGDRQRKAYQEAVDVAKRFSDPPPAKEEWMAAHPPGYVEYVDAIGPRGRYGKWLRARKAVTRVDDTVFMHAGIAPEAPGGLDDVNRDVARAIQDWDAATGVMERERLITAYSTLQEVVAAAAADLQRISAALAAKRPLDSRVTQEYVDHLKAVVDIGQGPLLAAAGPMWFRGLSETPTTETADQVTALLSRLGATRMVVAHTPRLPGRIVPRFDNRVFPIDTGMLSAFYPGGRASALEIAGPRVSALYAGERDVLVER